MRRGAALMVVLVTVTIVGVMLAVTVAAFVRTSTIATDRRARAQLYYAAEAGLERFKRGEAGTFTFAGCEVKVERRDGKVVARAISGECEIELAAP